MSYVTVLILEDTTSSSVYYTTECSWAHSGYRVLVILHLVLLLWAVVVLL